MKSESLEFEKAIKSLEKLLGDCYGTFLVILDEFVELFVAVLTQ